MNEPDNNFNTSEHLRSQKKSIYYLIAKFYSHTESHLILFFIVISVNIFILPMIFVEWRHVIDKTYILFIIFDNMTRLKTNAAFPILILALFTSLTIILTRNYPIGNWNMDTERRFPTGKEVIARNLLPCSPMDKFVFICWSINKLSAAILWSATVGCLGHLMRLGELK